MRLILFLIIGSLFFPIRTVDAQVNNPLLEAEIEDVLDATSDTEASVEATATESSSLASPSAEVQEKQQEKIDKDITETSGQQKSKLAAYLDENPPGNLSWNNFLQHAIRAAVASGVPANVLVLILLFPLIAAFIASSRHIIGLRGFGIYIPAVLSVALVSTGIFAGLSIFAAIVGTALLAKKLLSRVRLPYLPRTAMTLWAVSLGILALFLLAPVFKIESLIVVNIFPILILVLLGQNFLDAQASTKQSDALALTIETLVLAFISGLLLQWEFLQKLALVEPELLLAVIAIVNLVVGRFTGLRLAEWLRFKPIIEE